MVGLYIFLGIIAFLVLILSIRITLDGEYFDEFKLSVSWLFLKFAIIPSAKKDKPPKEKKVKEEKPKEAPAENGENKENIFITFYKNQGFNGVIDLVNNAAKSVGKLLLSLKKHIIIREIFLKMTVTSPQDAAQTAIDYGNVCQKVFPALSFICHNLKVKKYNAEIEPDFIGVKNTAEFSFSVSVRPIFVLSAAIVLVVRLFFKVVIKFLKGIKNNNQNENINEGGAL